MTNLIILVAVVYTVGYFLGNYKKDGISLWRWTTRWTLYTFGALLLVPLTFIVSNALFGTTF